MNNPTEEYSYNLSPKLYNLVKAAIRSPSGDNCQPWEFVIEDSNRILIRTVIERAKSFFDYKHHGTLLSLGATIENIRIQAASESLASRITRFSDSNTTQQETEVVIELRQDTELHMDDETASAVFTRTVNRRPFLPVKLAPEILDKIIGNPIHGVGVSKIERFSDKYRWSHLIYLADRIRYSHPEIHEELFSKILFTKQMAEDKMIGLEIDRLGAGPLAGPLMRLLQPWSRMEKLSRYGIDSVLANHSRFLALATGALILLTIENDSEREWVKAGEQMERIWVNAQREGLCIHPMTVALYLDQRYQEEGGISFLPNHQPYLNILRENLSELLADRIGAIIFRIGYAWKMKDTSIRLPIDTFLRKD